MIKVLIRCIITGVIILTLSVSLFSSRIFAQAGTVKAEQKISDTQGGFTGTLNNNDFFGFTSASIGDLNNDGIIDIVVGALADDDGGNNRGAVWILFMNTDGTVNGYSKISDTQGGFTGTLDNDDCFGYAVASLGDLDGDGISDLAVGAYFDDDGGSARGAVWVLFMNTDGTVKSHQKISDTQGGFTGTLKDKDYFGSSISAISDLDSDGNMDLIVGAYGDDDGGNARGAAWILFLNSDGTVKAHQKISDTQGSFNGILDDADYFGKSVALVGDIDEDGIADIAIGAYYDDDGGTSRGAIWILFLNTNGTVKGYQKISDTEGGFTGVLDNTDYFGKGITPVGDLNGDGNPDIVVSAPYDDDGGVNRGAAWVLFLNNAGVVISHQKISDLEGNFGGTLDNVDLFGSSISSLGDLDGDGITDLIIGAYRDEDGGTDRGAIWILSMDGQSVKNTVSSGDWSDTTVWDCKCVPADTNDVIIETGHTVNLTTDVTVNNLTIEQGGTLDVDSVNNYTINLKGNFKNSNVFMSRKGLLNLTGTRQQLLKGTNNLYDLTLNNSNGARIISGINKIKNRLTLTLGDLNTAADSFILISDSNKTARIAGSGTGTITTDITVQRFIMDTAGYRFFSSPVKNATVNDLNKYFYTWGFTGSDDPSSSWVSLYVYDETLTGQNDTGWIAVSNITDKIAIGTGIIAYVDNSDLPNTVAFTNPPNLGSYSLSVTYTTTIAGVNHDGWNLVGNTYPSPIDWDASSGWTKVNIDDAIYIWNSSNESYSSYITGTGTNGGSNIIPSSQSFWVKANAASPTLSISRGACTNSDTSFLMKDVPEEQIFKLRLANSHHYDEVVIRFSDDAKASFDGNLDAYKLFSKPPALYTKSSDGYALSINSLPWYTTNKLVPLILDIDTLGNYTFSMEYVSGFKESALIYLIDSLTGKKIDLRQSKTYSTSIGQGMGVQRFYLEFTIPIVIDVNPVSCNGEATGSAIINYGKAITWNYIVIDALGDTIITRTNVNTIDTINGLYAGEYSLHFTIQKQYDLKEVFYILEPLVFRSSTTSYKSTCSNSNDGYIGLSITGGTAPYSTQWSNGSTNQNVFNLTSGKYSVIITDVEGCEITDSLTIQNTDPVGKDFYVKKDTVYISQNGLVEFKTSSTEPVSCIWDFGDGSYKSTITEPFHMYDETGEYIATLIATNNICTDTSYFKITVMDEPILPNGMPEFSFYPNPVITSSLNVHAEGIRDIELYVNIYNNKGDLVYTELIIKANGEFNTTIEMDGNFHAGSYILILSSPFRVFSKEKIIVTSN